MRSACSSSTSRRVACPPPRSSASSTTCAGLREQGTADRLCEPSPRRGLRPGRRCHRPARRAARLDRAGHRDDAAPADPPHDRPRPAPVAPPGGTTPGPVRLSCRGLTTADDSCRDITLDGARRRGSRAVRPDRRGPQRMGAGAVRPAPDRFRRGVGRWGRGPAPLGPGQMAARGSPMSPKIGSARDCACGLSVRANAVLAMLRRLATLGWLLPAREKALRSRILARLDVRLRSAEQPVGTLVGRQPAKGRRRPLAGATPRVLILDEPTRGVDVGAREEIYAAGPPGGRRGPGRRPHLVGLAGGTAARRPDRRVPLGPTRGRVDAGVSPGRGRCRGAAPRRGRGDRHGVARSRLAQLGAPCPMGWAWRRSWWRCSSCCSCCTGQFLQPATLRGLAVDAALLSFCALAARWSCSPAGWTSRWVRSWPCRPGVAGQLWETRLPAAAGAAGRRWHRRGGRGAQRGPVARRRGSTRSWSRSGR